MKHTEGKWRVEGFCVKVGEAFDAVIAECTDYDGKALANAQLIATAPELLEACKKALKGYEGILEYQHGKGEHQNLFTVMLEQAISKAEGRE